MEFTVVFCFRKKEVRSKRQSNIDPKMVSKMECILISVFDRCLLIYGSKLAPKINQKSIPHFINWLQNKRRFRWFAEQAVYLVVVAWERLLRG